MAAYYLRPDEMWQRGGTVTTTAGTTDSDYTDDWVVDDRANRPAKATSGTVTWSIASTSGSISGVVVANHNIDGARTITIGGGASATGAAPAARPNGIPYNAWIPIVPTAAGATTLTVGVASNSVSVVIGEVVAGVFRTFPTNGLLVKETYSRNRRLGPDVGALSVSPYDSGVAQRSWETSAVATATQLDLLMAWFEAQRNWSRFSVFVPDSTINDAALVYLDEPEWEALGTTGGHYKVRLPMVEVPRVRW